MKRIAMTMKTRTSRMMGWCRSSCHALFGRVVVDPKLMCTCCGKSRTRNGMVLRKRRKYNYRKNI